MDHEILFWQTCNIADHVFVYRTSFNRTILCIFNRLMSFDELSAVLYFILFVIWLIPSGK